MTFRPRSTTRRYSLRRTFGGVCCVVLGTVAGCSSDPSTPATNSEPVSASSTTTAVPETSEAARSTTTTISPGTGLQALATDDDLAVGTAVRAQVLVEDADYADTISSQFGSVTPEHGLKWEPIHPEPHRYDFSLADPVFDFASEHDLEVRGHTLIWHRSQPAWLTGRTWTRQELLSVLSEHIHAVVGRYRGRARQWDVVNEAVGDDGALRDDVWLRTLGPDYIAAAFRLAHEADPEAVLFYNDFGIEEPGPKADSVFALVKSLVDQGVPIGGIGFQAHGVPGFPSADDLAAEMARYGELGLEVAVTELDVRVTVPASPRSLRVQADTYRDTLDACLRTPACHSFTMWGFTDSQSWIEKAFPGQGAATLFDVQLQPKPAYTAVEARLRAGR